MSWWYDQLAQIFEKKHNRVLIIITQFTLDTFMIQFVCSSLPYLKRSSWFLIVHKGKYEVALGVMRVERRKFLLFLPDFGAISYFVMEDLLWQSIENWLPMRRIVRLFQSLMGGGRECKVYHDTAKMCHPIRIFAHDTWNIHIPSEKKISMLGGIKHSYVTFNSLENLVPVQVSASRQTESHKKQSNTTQQNGTEMETN